MEKFNGWYAHKTKSKMERNEKQEIEEFIKRFENKSNSELVMIIKEHTDYQPIAVDAAWRLLEQRNYTTAKNKDVFLDSLKENETEIIDEFSTGLAFFHSEKLPEYMEKIVENETPQIKNIEGITVDELNRELQRGGKFVIFHYCISIIFMTFRQGSGIFFIRAGESTFRYSIEYTLLTLFLGWWGIPWGPIYTIGSLFTNLTGGKDVTQEIINALNKNLNTNKEDE